MAIYTDMADFISGIELDDEVRQGPPRISAQGRVLFDDLPAVRPDAPAPWHPRLPFDIALGETDDQILSDRYNITRLDLESLYFIPAFRREVADHQTSIRENGITFKQKAKVQAEIYLEVLDDIVNNEDVSAATRLDAIKSCVKWADLEPKDKAVASSNTPQFNIQINL